MKTMFKALWLIMVLLAITSCKKTKTDVVVNPSENNKLVVINDISGTTYGVNAQTGVAAWKAANPGGGGNYIISPAVTSDAVVVPDMSTSKLFSYNTNTGALLWSKNYIYSSYYASPVVKNGIAYIANNDRITGYTVNNGVAVKEMMMPNNYGANSLNLVNDLFITATCGGYLFGISAEGIKQWEYQSNYGCYHNNPAINKGIIYILSSGGKLSAVNAATGAEVWSRDESQYVENASVVYYDGMLFVTGIGNKAYAFEAYDGDLVHTYTLPDNEYIYYYAAPTIVDGKLYLLTNEATLVAYDVSSESIAWQKKLDIAGGRMMGRITIDNRTESVSALSSVVVANNMLFVTAGKTLYALTVKGETKWMFTAEDYMFASPVVLSDFNKAYRNGNAGIAQ